ncbi:MAG: hypothetical protein ABI898_04040 [Sphingomonadales bacterium]
MIWLLSTVAVIFVVLMFRPKKRKMPSMRFDEQKARARQFPADQQRQLAEECRQNVLWGYDERYQQVKSLNRTDDVAHQTALLAAAQLVLANLDHKNPEHTKALQMETAPFANVDHALGKSALAEYLVWKFFPNLANVEVVQEAVSSFLSKLEKDEHAHDRLLPTLVFSNEYDWQQFALNKISSRLGSSNA